MEPFEMAEKLKQTTGVTFEEAKAALDACGGDMLDAAIYLEKQGCTHQSGSTYSTKQPPVTPAPEPVKEEESFGKAAGNALRWLVRWFGKLLKIGNNNYFCVCHEGSKPVKIPVTLFVIGMLIAFWLIAILLVIGLFTDYSYHFEGPDFGKKQVNDVMDQVSATANQVKEDFLSESNKKED